MDEVQSYLDKKSINDQLSTDEKRQLNYINSTLSGLGGSCLARSRY